MNKNTFFSSRFLFFSLHTTPLIHSYTPPSLNPILPHTPLFFFFLLSFLPKTHNSQQHNSHILANFMHLSSTNHLKSKYDESSFVDVYASQTCVRVNLYEIIEDGDMENGILSSKTPSAFMQSYPARSMFHLRSLSISYGPYALLHRRGLISSSWSFMGFFNLDFARVATYSLYCYGGERK